MVPPPLSGIGRTIYGIIVDLTEPVLRLVRGLLPPIRMGTMALDLSPIIVFIALGIIRSALCGEGSGSASRRLDMARRRKNREQETETGFAEEQQLAAPERSA